MGREPHQEGVQGGGRDQPALEEIFPERPLPRPLEVENRPDLRAGKQPQADGRTSDPLPRHPLLEQEPDFLFAEQTPAPADLAEAFALPSLPEDRRDQLLVGDRALAMEKLAEAKVSAGEGSRASLMARPGCARGGRPLALRPRVTPARWSRGAALVPEREEVAQQSVGAGGLDEALRRQVLVGCVGHPIRMGEQGPASPGAVQPSRVQVRQRRGVRIETEEDAAGIEERAPVRCIHDHCSSYTGRWASDKAPPSAKRR